MSLLLACPLLMGQGCGGSVLPNDQVLPAALEIARDIATNTAPLSVAYSKRLLWDSWNLSASEVETSETEYHHYLMAHGDAREGVLAFLEKRSPQWKGRVSKDWKSYGSKGE